MSPFALRGLAAVTLAYLLVGCAPAPEAYSFDGRPLRPPPLPDDVARDREGKLFPAQQAWRDDFNDLDNIVWYGRRLAYVGRYREAIKVYTGGLRAHPGEPHLLRHRGHRYITLRRIDDAIADLEAAAAAIRGQPDEVEPDGLPNRRNIPTSTLQSNIWYHLGLACYLRGDYQRAAEAYVECKAVSRNPDMLCATLHWLHMTLRRLDRSREARQILEPIHRDMDVIENEGYHRLLLMYKGELDVDQLMADVTSDEGSIASATVAYGVARWLRDNGREEEGVALLASIVAGPQWAAFGHIAAEAELYGVGG